MMKSVIPILISIVIIFTFSSMESRNNEDVEGSVYFSNYNQVLHFRYDLTKEQEDDLIFGKIDFEEYPTCLFNRLPNKLDSNLAENLFHWGYVRNSIKKKHFPTLDSIFCYHKVEESFSLECMPIYRDILIFRNKKEVKGIAQICFSCMHFFIIGANTKTYGFGMNDEFEKLKIFLSQQ